LDTRRARGDAGPPAAAGLPPLALRQHALAESDKCRLLLENTAGAGNTIGRTFEELREVIDRAGGDKRIGVCLDSCHMFATGFDIRTADKVSEVVDRFAATVGIRPLKSLHVNDSMTPLGSNRARKRRANRRGARAR
jgi:deoxyribonuclease-4